MPMLQAVFVQSCNPPGHGGQLNAPREHGIGWMLLGQTALSKDTFHFSVNLAISRQEACPRPAAEDSVLSNPLILFS